MMLEPNELYDLALRKNGVQLQTIVCIEELSELQKELTKMLRSKGDKAHLAEEIADVQITVEQMIQFYLVAPDVEQYRRYKLNRLESELTGKYLASDQLCWSCQNYAKGCEWSESKGTVPVPGWTAVKTVKDGVVSYKVTGCKKYRKDED